VAEIVLALSSALCFAGSHVVSKRGLRGTSVTAGFMVIVGSAWVVVMIPLVLAPPESLSAGSVALFAVSGVFAPAVSRAAALAGVHVLGPSIAVPIQQGLRPLIVVPAAVVLLGEAFGITRVLGVTAIVAGGWILSRDPDAAAAAVAPDDGRAVGTEGSVATAVTQRARPITRGFRRGIVFPIAAAIGYATSDLLVKAGLGGASDPVYAAPVSIGTGFLLWTLAHVLPSVRRRFRLGRDVGWLVASGVLMGTAILLLFQALARGDVSLVSPVVGTQPLFVMVLSALLLRHLERRERSTILAVSLVVAGTVLVSV
jgi:drug/metabolite transporter (DMT)-like permease